MITHDRNEPIHVVLPKELHARLDAICKHRGDKSYYIRTAIELFLINMERNKKIVDEKSSTTLAVERPIETTIEVPVPATIEVPVPEVNVKVEKKRAGKSNRSK